MLLLEQLAHKTLLSIPQTLMNVKFILRKFRKNVDFCGITVHDAIKYSINAYECQIYFFRYPQSPLSGGKWVL